MSRLTLDRALETFAQRFQVSGELTKQAKQLIPGGYSRNSFNFGPHAIFVESGDGAYIQTSDGYRMLDLNNNYTVNVLGQNHPAVREALIAAIPEGISFGNPGRREADLARILIDRIPSVEQVQFSCSATESCMSAVRVARGYTGRTLIAKFEGGYHGFSDPLQVSSHPDPALAGPDDAPISLVDSTGNPTRSAEQTVLVPQNDWEGTERILRAHAAEIACFIMELQSGAGGLVTLDRDFVARVRELTAELGIVLIFDETISLRADYHGMQGVYGVTPDLTVMGKMIGGGMPLGAIGGKREIMSVLDGGGVVISGTHHGHQLSLAAGIACMETMDRQAFDRLNANSRRIMTEVNEWAKGRHLPFRVYGGGFSHLAYGFLRDASQPVHTHRDYWRNIDGERTQAMSIELANRNVFPVHRGEFSLSLPMSDDDISQIIETFQGIVLDLED